MRVQPRRATPSIVPCNTGLGPEFWISLAVYVVIAALFSTGGAAIHPLLIPVFFAGGLLLAGLILALVLATRPRLEIDLARGVLRTDRAAIPFPAIAEVRFWSARSGTWATFYDDNGPTSARMAISSMYSPPNAAQWAALRDALVIAANARSRYRRLPELNRRFTEDALRALDEQVAWCAAGNRSSSSKAPVQRILRSRIRLP